MPSDANRQQQIYNANIAYSKGYRKAKRHNGFNACPTCRHANGEVLDIMTVIYGQADHKFGQCYFSYIS